MYLSHESRGMTQEGALIFYNIALHFPIRLFNPKCHHRIKLWRFLQYHHQINQLHRHRSKRAKRLARTRLLPTISFRSLKVKP